MKAAVRRRPALVLAFRNTLKPKKRRETVSPAARKLMVLEEIWPYGAGLVDELMDKYISYCD